MASSSGAFNERRRPRPRPNVEYRQYTDERDLPTVMQLIDNELSEPYGIFTYRYFLRQWPKLCWMAFDGQHCVGCVVSKQELHKKGLERGYIAMLVVERPYRGHGIGKALVRKTIEEMRDAGADEVVLEAETSNEGALRLYGSLGFIRDKLLPRYYLSGSDAFRLKLMLPLQKEREEQMRAEKAAAERIVREEEQEAAVAAQLQQLQLQLRERGAGGGSRGSSPGGRPNRRQDEAALESLLNNADASEAAAREAERRLRDAGGQRGVSGSRLKKGFL